MFLFDDQAMFEALETTLDHVQRYQIADADTYARAMAVIENLPGARKELDPSNDEHFKMIEMMDRIVRLLERKVRIYQNTPPAVLLLDAYRERRAQRTPA